MNSRYDWVRWAFAATWSAVIGSGCAGADTGVAAEEPLAAESASRDAAERAFDPYALAWEYKFEEKDPGAPTRVLDTIRALPLEDARAFHEALADVNGITGELLRYSTTAFEVAVEYGVSFIDLDGEMRAEAFRRTFPDGPQMTERRIEMSTEPHVLDTPQPLKTNEVDKGICVPPFTSCSVDPNFDNGYAVFGSSCPSGCVAASSVDRLSNESCELLGCDYRIIFPAAQLLLLDGRTAEGDCAVSSFPGGIGAYSTAGKTFAQLGFNTLLLNCGLSSSQVKAGLFQAFK